MTRGLAIDFFIYYCRHSSSSYMDRYSIMNKAFEYYRFAKLVSLKMALMGQTLFVRFATQTVRTDYDYTVVNYIDRCRITQVCQGWVGYNV